MECIVIAVDQNLFSEEDINGNVISRGNCLVACVASILELSIDEIPHFITYEHWDKELERFLKERGYKLKWYYGYGHNMPDGYTIATGLSPRSRKDKAMYHACVAFNGEIVHDPHYSKENLCGPIMYYMGFEKDE